MPYPRPSTNTHAPPVSYTPASCDSPSSPTTTRGRRPSLSNPMHWLSRNSTQSSVVSLKQTRISEPKLIHADLMSPRAGILGSGAIVVRTPEEALRDTNVRLTPGETEQQQEEEDEEEQQEPDSQEIEYSPPTSEEEDEIPSPTDSPALPPLPSGKAESYFEPLTPQPFTFPDWPNRAMPSAPISALRPSLKTKRTESVDAASVVPALPATISTSPAPPPFNPILLSDAPPPTADRSKVIVSLETCTATYKTTLDTLSSRPSHLSNYLASQFGRRRSDSLASSVYSTESDDMSAYRRHLTSQGLLPQSTSVHIFLDRPSEPYVHILNYLRTPRTTGEGPEVLPPRAAQSGLDAILELRDEAAYLGLDDLQKLCVEEIRQRHRARPRSTRGNSSGASIHSMHASVSSLHTMLEQVEPQHSRSRSNDTGVAEISGRSPPTPESWTGRRAQSSQPRHGSLRRPPPAGWI